MQISVCLVLIETLWNVKIVTQLPSMVTDPVLIETLWNVKLEEWRRRGLLTMGINRNIVECKVLTPDDCLEYGLVLIETLWNVKISVQNSSSSLRMY